MKNETAVTLKQHSESISGNQSPGMILQESRHAMGFTQAEVARRLCLTVKVINSIERDDYKNLPGLSYSRGYLRAYANLLEIPPEKILQAFEKQDFTAKQTLPPLKKYQVEDEDFEKHGVAKGTSYLLLAALLVLVFLWWHEHHDRTQNLIYSALSQGSPVSLSLLDNATDKETIQDIIAANALDYSAIAPIENSSHLIPFRYDRHGPEFDSLSAISIVPQWMRNAQ